MLKDKLNFILEKFPGNYSGIILAIKKGFKR